MISAKEMNQLCIKSMGFDDLIKDIEKNIKDRAKKGKCKLKVKIDDDLEFKEKQIVANYFRYNGFKVFVDPFESTKISW